MPAHVVDWYCRGSGPEETGWPHVSNRTALVRSHRVPFVALPGPGCTLGHCPRYQTWGEIECAWKSWHPNRQCGLFHSLSRRLGSRVGGIGSRLQCHQVERCGIPGVSRSQDDVRDQADGSSKQDSVTFARECAVSARGNHATGQSESDHLFHCPASTIYRPEGSRSAAVWQASGPST